MRTLLTILALAGLLCIPPQPAGGAVGQGLHAQDKGLALPVLRERAAGLVRRVREARQRFLAALSDLDRLDVPMAALELDRELCRIEEEVNRLGSAGRGRDASLANLLETALEDTRWARARMEETERLGSTAHSFLRLLREMRAARRRRDLEGVLALYRERRSDTLPEQWAQPVRRILEELDGLRVAVTMERNAPR